MGTEKEKKNIDQSQCEHGGVTDRLFRTRSIDVISTTIIVCLFMHGDHEPTSYHTGNFRCFVIYWKFDLSNVHLTGQRGGGHRPHSAALTLSAVHKT